MRFGVFVPDGAARSRACPVLYYLAGLTCTEETFAIKAGAQRVAAALGLVLVTCDTSPRAARYPGRRRRLGLRPRRRLLRRRHRGALARDATAWTRYVTRELPARRRGATSRSRADARGIFGHSMGGHGALALALRNPDRYRSVSAFAPDRRAVAGPLGQKAFAGYLGADARGLGRVRRLRAGARAARCPSPLLVDQGTADKFLDAQLKPELFEAACADAGPEPARSARHAGYDHSYYFIATLRRRAPRAPRARARALNAAAVRPAARPEALAVAVAIASISGGDRQS